MHINYVFKDVNEALPTLLGNLLMADEVGSRAGRTKELTHVGITLTEPQHREILLDDRKPNLAAQIAETMWVVSGRDDMEFLSHYLPRALDFSDDGKTWRAGYGKRLRNWGQGTFVEDHLGKPVDQLAYVVDLLKRDPGTRQAVMSIWDPTIDTEPGKDIPCNDWLHFLSRNGYLDLHVALRSNDVVWGWSGINQFEWSALLEVVAGLTGMKMGSLHFSTTSFHIYEHHWAKAEKIIHAATLPGNRWRDEIAKDSPRFNSSEKQGDKVYTLEEFDSLCEDWFRLEYDIRTGSPLVGGYIDRFPEPMLRSWLIVLDWWWNGRHAALKDLGDTRLEMATHYSVQPPLLRRKAQQFTIGLINQGRSEEVREALRYIGAERVSAIPENRLEEFLEVFQGSLDLTRQFIASKRQAAADDTLAAFVGQGPVPEPSDFIKFAIATHDEKHAAYGDSWRKRGESFSIIPNIARKVDRVGAGTETSDETSADTALDLMVYCAKYLEWLEVGNTDDTDGVTEILTNLDLATFPALNEPVSQGYLTGLQDNITAGFDRLLDFVEHQASAKAKMDQTVAIMENAYRLAIFLHNVPTKEHDDYRGADVD